MAVLGDAWHEPLQTLTHMGIAEGNWHGGLKLLRASFSGELAYEVHCRPSQATSLWQALIESGLQPYGIEAVDILRVEKGYLSAAEINGQTTPGDLAMTSMSNANPRCIGRALLERPAFAAQDRPCLVGLRAHDRRSRFLAGAQITQPREKVRSSGYVTSAVFSPALNEWIGLGLVSRQCSQTGTQLLARDPLRSLETPISVVSLVHFDPQGQRMKA
jgi:sarcosine oxidase subunit alpha